MLRFLDWAGRPLTRVAVLVLMCSLVWFFVQFGNAITVGLYRWSEGEGVDLNGLAAVLAAGASLLGVVMPFIVSLFRDRRIERVEQIRAGAPPRTPFGRSGPEPAPETWPRPGDSA